MIKLPQIIRFLAVLLLSTAFAVTTVHAAGHADSPADSDGSVDRHASPSTDEDVLDDPDCD